MSESVLLKKYSHEIINYACEPVCFYVSLNSTGKVTPTHAETLVWVVKWIILTCSKKKPSEQQIVGIIS